MYAVSSRLALEVPTQKAYQMNCINESYFSSGNNSVLAEEYKAAT